MRLLLDTRVLLWALAEPARLPSGTRDLVENREHEVFFSAANLWEIAVKRHIGRLPASARPDHIAQAADAAGFVELPVRARHVLVLDAFPLPHRDPFDRILVAQAVAESARLLTADRALRRYSDVVEPVE